MTQPPSRSRMLPATVVLALLLTAGFHSPVFFRTVGGAESDRGVSVLALRDGGYLAVGVTRSLGAGGEDVYLVRTDAEGEVAWTRAYGGPGTDNGWAAVETKGGFVITGFTDSFGAGGLDCYLVATDRDGVMRWSATLGGAGDERCWGSLVTDDGGHLLVGETTGTATGAEDCYLVRTDEAGRELWSRSYGGESGDRCFGIAAVEGGGYMLIGQSYSEGAGDRDAYLIRTDELGVQMWSKTFGGPASDVGHAISRTRDGDFLVTGYTSSFANGGDDPYLHRIGGNGELRWTRVIPMAGINRTITGEESIDGGFYLGGFTAGDANRPESALLVRLDADGRLDWSRELTKVIPGPNAGYTVRATRDGGAILTGRTSVAPGSGTDLFLLKVDRDGLLP